MPRFKHLSDRAQVAFSKAFKQFTQQASDELFLPDVPATDWLIAFRAVNVKLGFDGMPTLSGMVRVVEYLENKLLPIGICPRCSSN
jgi:hypothetical protein